MWYGLKEGGKLVAVKFFRRTEPDMHDFGTPLLPGITYSVVVVRIREVGTMNFS